MARVSTAQERDLSGINVAASNDSIVQRLPGGEPALAHVSDDELLANTRRLVGKSNQLLAALLLHLAEVEARGAHRSRRCASLYTYCIYELRFSEDAAARRSAAARFSKEFPALLDAVAAGELHLTGLLMIGPHLTPANHLEVLGRAKFRTKKELARLVRDLSPLPRLPDVIQPLGPALPRWGKAPTWGQFVTSLAPEVRELPAGERPGEWAADGATDGHVGGGADGHVGECAGHDGRADAARTDNDTTDDEGALPVGPVPSNLPPVTGPQVFQLQFGTVEEHVHLVERAKALLARTRPGITLGELHLEAMKLFVAALEKRKFAVKEQPRQRVESSERRGPPTEAPSQRVEPCEGTEAPTEAPRQRVEASEVREPPSEAPRQRVEASEVREPPSEAPRQRVEASPSEGREPPSGPPRQSSRYIPAAVRREVYQRDGACCTYVDARGLRCSETRYLELHHLQPFAKNGAHVASNLTLRCSAHNALAAEADFGATLVAERRSSTRHEAFARTRVERPRPS